MSNLFGKKLLCGLLAFALVLGYFPGAVFAAETEETEETEVTIAPIEVQADTLNASYVDGGMCGYFSNVSWKLYSDGTLIFSGTGEMAVNKEESAPWLRYASDITSVVIESGVTDIEDFENCVNLTSVSIADTVTQIWGAAFRGCTSLPGITIPDNVTYIGGSAFSGCTSLTSIRIPASVVNIGESAFASCDSLTGIWVDEGNQNYASDASGVLFNKEKTTLLQAPGGIRGTYSVPDGVTAIGSNAFYGCKRLTGVTLPSSVTSIGYSAFRGCVSLTDVTIPYRVTTIDSFTFSGCTSLSAITIPMSVTEIKEGAFASCGALKEITFVGSAPEIEAGSTWYTPAFSGVTATAYYPAGNATWTEDVMQDYGGTITWKAAAEDAPGSIIASGACGEKLTWTLTDTGKLTISGTGAMTDYSYEDRAPWSGLVKSVEIKASVTRIGDYAFAYCNALTDINLPDSVTDIGSSAFMGCSSLADITIPNQVVSIGDSAFSGCSGLNKITLPDSVTSIGGNAFSYTGYYNNAENWENDALYLGHFILELSSDYYGSYYVKAGTKYIADRAFDSCKKMSSIILPDSVVGIGNYAFDYCQKLTSVTIPDSVTSIGDGAFYYCKYLNKINIPESVTSIGAYTFYYCEYLSNITIPESVTSIGNYAFSDSGLREITIPESVTSIGDYAFYGSYLKEITFAGNAPAISENAFYYRTATAYYPGDNATWTADVMQNYGGTITWKAIEVNVIASGTCGENLTWTLTDNEVLTISGTGTMTDFGYGEAPWYKYLWDFNRVVVETGVTSIGESAFYDCYCLGSITLPDSVTRIGDYAFWGCSSLTSAVIPTGVTTIGYYVFASCTSLTEITLPDSVTSIGKNAFDSCEALTGITLPDRVTSIGDGAFFGCRSLTNITIPAGVTSIEDWVFGVCTSLTEITFVGNAPAIGGNTFNDVTATAYYPVGNDTWTESVMQNYGGTITWKAVCSNHQWGKWTVTTDPTCTKAGEKTRTCGLCGEIETRSLDALGHKTALQNAKDATCTEDGYTGDEICAVCGETVKQGKTIAALGHDYQSVVTDPTCTEQGYTTHTCTRCGDSKVDSYVDALGHKTALQNAKDATCTEDGYTGDEICTVCGEIVKKGETIAALGHSFGQWTVTTEPTCTEQGEEARTCSVCGETEKREVAALGHKLTLVAEKEADFTVPGMKEHYVCEVCGKLFADEAGAVEVTEEELVIPQLIQVVDGNVEISEEAVDKAIEIVEDGGEIRLPISDAGQVKSVTMPAKALSKVAELDASLTVEMTAATVTMDTAALEAVAQKLGEDDVVTLKIAQIPTEYLTAEQQAAVKDKNVVGAISAQLLVNDQPIGSEASGGFGDGRVTVQIPFIPDQGTTAEDYKVLYVAADGTVTEIPIAYEDGCLVVAVGHFSEYVIVKTKTVMLGDVNGDGKITVTDLMCLANHLAGKAEINEANSDLDGNGKVNVTDLMRLANVFAGKATLG